MRVAILVLGVLVFGCDDTEQARLNRFTDSARIYGPAISRLRSASRYKFSETAEKWSDNALEESSKRLDEVVENEKEADAWAGADNRKAVYHRHKAEAAERGRRRAEADIERWRQAADKARKKETESEAAWSRSFQAHVSDRDVAWLYDVMSKSGSYDKRMQAFYILKAYGGDPTYPDAPPEKKHGCSP